MKLILAILCSALLASCVSHVQQPAVTPDVDQVIFKMLGGGE